MTAIFSYFPALFPAAEGKVFLWATIHHYHYGYLCPDLYLILCHRNFWWGRVVAFYHYQCSRASGRFPCVLRLLFESQVVKIFVCDEI